MIVQAIGLLDDLDKELNTYAMRVREWYGWHFPEMTRVVTDNLQYAKTVRAPRHAAICLPPAPCWQLGSLISLLSLRAFSRSQSQEMLLRWLQAGRPDMLRSGRDRLPELLDLLQFLATLLCCGHRMHDLIGCSSGARHRCS